MSRNPFRDYPDIVNVRQLCEMLHIGRSSAYTLLRENHIRHIRVGSKILIPKQSVVEFINQQID